MAGPAPGATFFIDWPTWVKLASLLAGCTGIILMLAIIVKVTKWRRAVGREKKSMKEQAVLAERGEMTLMDQSNDEIPFGVRALIEDPSVEGVWDSRTHTPQHYDGSCSRPLSLMRDRSLNPLHKPSITTLTPPESADTSLASPHALPKFHNAAATTSTSSNCPSRTTRDRIIISYSGPKEQCGPADRIADMITSNVRSPENKLPSKMPIVARAGSSGRKFVISSRQRHQPTSSRPQAQSEDIGSLERMRFQRDLHVAESGQLLPHSQRRRHTDMTSTTPLVAVASDSEDSDSSADRSMSWPPTRNDVSIGRLLSRKVQRMEDPKPLPFRAFVESVPSVKDPVPAPPSAWTAKTTSLVEGKLAIVRDSKRDSRASAPSRIPTIPSPTDATCVTGSVSITNTRTRKVNSGFEVLPAGSLVKAPAVKEFGLWPAPEKEQLHAKKPKKLQKKTRSSASGDRESVGSRRFSEESFRLPVL